MRYKVPIPGWPSLARLRKLMAMRLAKPPAFWPSACALALVTAALYWPGIHHGFAVIDDGQYVTQNPWVNEGLSWASLRWAMTSCYAANWHPLTWLSHQVDWSLYGDFAGGHHLTNLLLHTLNTGLLFLLLRRLTGQSGRSWLVAALFGWHPLHVESVAWIAERKDLLSTLCLLGSIWAYSQYVSARAAAPENRRRAGGHYGLALGLFAAGLMSKPMLVTLPCLLLLLDYWPLQRGSGGANSESGNRPAWLWLLIEKLPFFALSGAACVVTLFAQHAGGAIKGIEQVPLTLRGLNALSAYGTYLRQFLWPNPLCVFYPLPLEPPFFLASVGVLLLVGLTALSFSWRRTSPWLLTGWLWFVGSLVPVIGLVQVGAQGHADRYTYIPSIGFFCALVWGVHHLLSRRRHGKWIGHGLAAASLAACLALTVGQLRCWRDNVQLFAHALAHTRNNAPAQNNLGVALSNLGRAQEALEHYREAIRLQPANAQARFNLGVELANSGQLEAAAEQFSEALHRDPQNASLLNNLGSVLAQQGKYPEALDQFRLAMRSNPQYAKSYVNAAAAYQALGQAEPAIAHYQAALSLSPGSIDTLRRLAFLLATCPFEAQRQPDLAVQLASRAVELTSRLEADPFETLAIAYGAAGQYSNAVATVEQGLKIAQTHGMAQLIGKFQRQLEAYRAGRNPEVNWQLGR